MFKVNIKNLWLIANFSYLKLNLKGDFVKVKTVYSNKTLIWILIFGTALFSVATIICIAYLIFNVLYEQMNFVLMYSVLIILFLCSIVLIMFSLNRFGCKVSYDYQRKLIVRKGFICGYKYQIKIEDIKNIIVVTFPQEATYYVFIDSINKKYDGGSKNSFIRIEKTKKNYEFIKQFWNKPIAENKQYVDLFK